MIDRIEVGSKPEIIDLTTYLFDHLKYNQKLTTPYTKSLEGNAFVIRYFLKENLTSIFGKTTFDSDEIDRVADQNKVVINSISDVELSIYTVETQIGEEIVGQINGETIFTIKNNNGVLINELIKEVEDGYQKIIYQVNNNESSYRFIIYTSKEGKLDFKSNFDARLTPIDTRINNCDIYELTRTEPSSPERSDSFIKRIFDNLMNGNLVKIATDDLQEANFSVEAIFDKLKEEYKRLNETQEKQLKK